MRLVTRLTGYSRCKWALSEEGLCDQARKQKEFYWRHTRLKMLKVVAMAGPTILLTARTGAFSAETRFLGQRVFNTGAAFEKSGKTG